MENKKVFCSHCSKEVDYTLRPSKFFGNVKGAEYSYSGQTPYCELCGNPVDVPEVSAANDKILMDLHRSTAGLVSLEIIREIPEKYCIGKRPLSLILGWGEQSFTRFFDGELPSKNFSDTLNRVYEDPSFYSELLESNKALVSDIAYKKSRAATDKILSDISRVSSGRSVKRTPFSELSKEELEELLQKFRDEYHSYQNRGLQLNMARGKPCAEQLDLSMDMMNVLTGDSDLHCDDGTDCRNYGVLGGIEEAKELLGSMIEVPAENIIIYGNSSLNVMYDSIARSMTHGVMGSTPWCKLDRVKFLCPVPGYDRHFAITQYFGIEMLNVPMNEEGPDMDVVEKLVSVDDSIKGIWCVPKYSNPNGITYSEKTVKRFARLRPAAKDFRIYWDNAYSVHHLYDENQDYLIEILSECKKAGNPDMVYKFTSTSKISFPGSGIAAIATSLNNMEDIKKQFSVQTIGHDKVNQLRHVRFFKNIDGITEHMRKHADILRPKFELVENIFESELGDLGVGTWTNPRGGYFISFDSLPGCAKSIVKRCKKAGVVLTPAGATYPYGHDPLDSNIRIAPSYPSLEDLRLAAKIFALSVKIESIKKLLGLANN